MRPLIFVVVIILAMVGYKIYSSNKAKSEAAKTEIANPGPKTTSGLPVDIYVAKKKITDNNIFASGTVQANEEVELRSEVSGRIVKLNIREGSFVNKGELIAKLSDDDLIAQLKKNKYEQELAKQIEARQKKLLEINAISKEEFDLAVNRVNTLGADREFLKVQLEKTSLRAPFSGKIGFKSISEGAYVTPNAIIASMVQLNPIKIDFNIPEKYSSIIKNGQTIIFSTDASTQSFEAIVIAIDPKVDESLRTLKIRARADNRMDLLKPGMFVRVEIQLVKNESIMIPSQAIVPILKGKKLYVMKNGKAEERIIQTGLRTDIEVEVDSGLSVGDSVVVSALMSIKANMPISVREIIQ